MCATQLYHLWLQPIKIIIKTRGPTAKAWLKSTCHHIVRTADSIIQCTHVLDRSAKDIFDCCPRKCVNRKSLCVISNLLWYRLVISCCAYMPGKAEMLQRWPSNSGTEIILSSRYLFISRLGSKLVLHS